MHKGHLISTDEFCTHYSVDHKFIFSLQQQGLIEIQSEDNIDFVDEAELQKIEKLIRLHYELDIDIEGIDAIFNLLQKMKNMEDEILYLRNQVRNLQNS